MDLNNMPFNRHENQELIQAFYKEPVPFQGADPSTARCIFIGLDANFDKCIENSEIFDDVKSYLRDGPEFWRQNEVHHPYSFEKYWRWSIEKVYWRWSILSC
jgi:hypothetical protein